MLFRSLTNYCSIAGSLTRRVAAPEFSRGFQPTVGVNFFPVASATIESRSNADVAEGSFVARATWEYSATVPWVETHG